MSSKINSIKMSVESSFIRDVEYDINGMYLFMTSGKAYHYPDVSRRLFTEMCESDSIGAFYNRHIKGSYDSQEIDNNKVPLSPVSIIPDQGRLVFKDGRYAVKLEYEFSISTATTAIDWETLNVGPKTNVFKYFVSIHKNGRTDQGGSSCGGVVTDLLIGSMPSHALKSVLEDIARDLSPWYKNDAKFGTKAQLAVIKAYQRTSETIVEPAKVLSEVDLLNDRGHVYGSKTLVKRMTDVDKKELKDKIRDLVKNHS